MGTITVSVRDDVEKRFRKVASATYGKRKGHLGEAISEAIREWSEKRTSVSKAMELLDKGFDMGRINYKKRSELHERGGH